ICRTAIITVQSTGSLDGAAEKIQQEAASRFKRRGITFRMVVVGMLASIPLLLAVGSRVYAEDVLRKAAAEVPADERDRLFSEGRQDPAFSCPPELGLSGSALLLPAGLLVILIEV